MNCAFGLLIKGRRKTARLSSNKHSGLVAEAVNKSGQSSMSGRVSPGDVFSTSLATQTD